MTSFAGRVSNRGSAMSAVSVFLALLVTGGAVMVYLQSSATTEEAHAAVGAVFDTDLSVESAMKQSQETGKPIYILATADWCGPCKQFKASTLADEQVVSQLKAQTVPYYLDVTTMDNLSDDERQLVNQLGVTSIPASFMLKDGAIAGKMVGGAGKDKFVAWVEQSVRAD